MEKIIIVVTGIPFVRVLPPRLHVQTGSMWNYLFSFSLCCTKTTSCYFRFWYWQTSVIIHHNDPCREKRKHSFMWREFLTKLKILIIFRQSWTKSRPDSAWWRQHGSFQMPKNVSYHQSTLVSFNHGYDHSLTLRKLLFYPSVSKCGSHLKLIFYNIKWMWWRFSR